MSFLVEKIRLILFLCLGVLTVCMYEHHKLAVPGSPGSPGSGVTDVSCYVSAGNQTWVPWRKGQCALPLSYLSSLVTSNLNTRVAVMCALTRRMYPAKCHSVFTVWSYRDDLHRCYTLLGSSSMAHCWPTHCVVHIIRNLTQKGL